MAASVEQQFAEETLRYWAHIYPPLDCWSVYEVLADGLASAKAERHDGLLMHDHARADRALDEIRELTVLCAAAADGIALQRARWMTGNRPWPLSRVMIQITPSPVSGRNGSTRAATGPMPPERPSSRLRACGGCGRGKVGRVPASTRNLRRGPRGPADLLPPQRARAGSAAVRLLRRADHRRAGRVHRVRCQALGALATL